MAAPVDADRATTYVSTATNTPAFNLPAGLVAGDVVVLAWRSGSGITTYAPPDASWVELKTGTPASDRAWIGYHVCDGSEGSTVTFTMTGTARRYHAIAIKVTGGGTPQASNPVTHNSINPNPPSFSPVGGSNDYLWIAYGSCEDQRSVTGFPTNYDNDTWLAITAGAASDKSTGFYASRQLTAASEDPGTFALSATANNNWMVTVAIPPGAAPPPDEFVSTVICY